MRMITAHQKSAVLGSFVAHTTRSMKDHIENNANVDSNNFDVTLVLTSERSIKKERIIQASIAVKCE